MANSKLFISYSWSNPIHEQWVLDLATELRQSGVDAILDKWDLKEGHDSVKFMEKMVNDPDIKKVVMVVDEVYAAKANERAGGVGTETQIISKEVYDNQEQDKFVAVIAEKDPSGKPYLPAYYKSRIYIDLSESDSYAENFEILLRWIYNKPLHKRPELGTRPSFLEDSEGISLGTTAALKRAIAAVKDNRPFSSGAIDEYFSIFSENLEKFRISDVAGELDDAVIDNIEKFIPHRNEAISLFITIAQYGPEEENIAKLHRFLESLIPYMEKPHTDRTDCSVDNFKFIVHELFLYAVSVLIKYERFEQANYLIQNQYYIDSDPYHGQAAMVQFPVFREFMPSLEKRNQRLELQRLSLRSDLLNERSQSSGIDFRYIMQGDFVLFMRSEIQQVDFRWFPDTLLYACRYPKTFEIFARSVSRNYFEKVKCLLNVRQPDDLRELMEAYKTDRRPPNWDDYESLNPAVLLGYEHLATKV
ncbi:MAG: TIR domain-containing protein [Candidatus Poribacteria bacterium]|nr:TIR domain-containing protein [Candidatus Poribacteria bacterium]